MKNAICIVALLLCFAAAPFAHELVVTFDPKELKSIQTEPIRFRVVVEPSAKCQGLIVNFNKAMALYHHNDRRPHATNIINIAQMAVAVGCWR